MIQTETLNMALMYSPTVVFDGLKITNPAIDRISSAYIKVLIGIAGAAIVRLAVYLKGKNAKKYRKGIEYGSARWSA